MNLKKLTNSKGTVFVEFVIVAVILFAVIDGALYFGLLFHRYSALSDAVTSSLRQLSTDVNVSGSNPTYSYSALTDPNSAAFIGKQIKNFIASRNYTSSTEDISIGSDDVTMCRDIDSRCKITVRAWWRHSCFFCIFTGSKDIIVIADSGFEDPCFITPSDTDPNRGCNDPAIPTCS